jgi:hypothetical protein
MFVERSNYFNTLGAVMNLVKGQPEKIDTMPPTMPPIENEGGYEICHYTAN